MSTAHPSLLHIFARNVQHYAFKRGWSSAQLAARLGITPHTMNRIRYGRGRYLDPEIMAEMFLLFQCEPNDLLLPQPGIDYTSVD
jgi:DNA-binding Xre family transcriptional regulator